MNEDEIKLIDGCIQSYKNMITYHRKQIKALELKKLEVYDSEDCPECYKFPIVNKRSLDS